MEKIEFEIKEIRKSPFWKLRDYLVVVETDQGKRFKVEIHGKLTKSRVRSSLRIKLKNEVKTGEKIKIDKKYLSGDNDE